MRIAILITAGIWLGQAHGVAAQQPQFDAVSVRSSAVPPIRLAYTANDSRFEYGFASLKVLIQMAYKVEKFHISRPDWMTTTRFDVIARLPAGSNKAQIPEMLQALLADRFGLILHREANTQPVYALLIGKSGLKLGEAAPDNQVDRVFLEGRSILSKIYSDEGDGAWTVSSEGGTGARQIFDGPRITMPELARTLMAYVELPVVDMTELKGPYHVRLDVPGTLAAARNSQRLAGFSPALPADPEGTVSIFSSVQTAGLALEKRRAPVDTLVIDHIEKVPTEN